MARLFAIAVMLFAMLHAALAVPHENVVRGLYFPRANITGTANTTDTTDTNSTVASTNETESAAAIKRAMRSAPITLRVPGRHLAIFAARSQPDINLEDGREKPTLFCTGSREPSSGARKLYMTLDGLDPGLARRDTLRKMEQHII
ncbi:hypothetical protein BJ166DRAFT_593518 [Pestalotiopsis sp. NC0098]|nr:hypothetical protein BJ166DRAFT_593518 [Pestalotiopsis sp. NC0098]